MPPNGLRLYDYAASGNCYKVRLLLAQLEQPYERVPIDIFAGATLADEYALINQFRSTPVLEIEAGRYLLESNAILFFLASGTPFLPSDAIEQAEVVRWLIYEQTDLIPSIAGLRFRLLTGRFTAEHHDAVKRRKNGEDALDKVEAHLSSRAFLVAERYTIADIAVYGYLHVAADAGYELDRWPSLREWLRTVAAQPRHVNDLLPYPANARPGAGRSIYEE